MSETITSKSSTKNPQLINSNTQEWWHSSPSLWPSIYLQHQEILQRRITGKAKIQSQQKDQLGLVEADTIVRERKLRMMAVIGVRKATVERMMMTLTVKVGSAKFWKSLLHP
jgi:hypothetical protein